MAITAPSTLRVYPTNNPVQNLNMTHIYIDPCLPLEGDMFVDPPIEALVTKPVEEILTTISKKESTVNAEEKKYSNNLKVYPNPINGNRSLNIDYSIESEEPELVTLSLISPLGERLKTVFQDRPHATGKFSTVISTTNLPSGILFVELRIGNYKLVRKVVKIDLN